MHLPRFLVLVLVAAALVAPAARADDPPTPAPSPSPQAQPEPSPATSQQALFRLLTGNTRYYQGRPIHANEGAFARSQSSEHQYPWAVVVTCSDSRVPPEIIFDQGLGQITVIRMWGAWVGETGVGSIEHALLDHGPTLIVVLGHAKCTAVKDAIENRIDSAAAGKVVNSIKPAVAAARKFKGDLLENSVKEHARMTARRLLANPIVAARVKAGKMRVVPCYYDIVDGHVKVLNIVKGK